MLSIHDSQIKLLEKLCNAMAVSGDETEVRDVVLGEVRSDADDVRVDVLGNVLVSKNASIKDAPRVLLLCHMDEPGFIIVNEADEGIYQFEVLGGIDTRYLAGIPLIVGREHSPGVIGSKPIHMSAEEELNQSITLDSMRIDLGPEGRAQPGDRATFSTKFRQVGPSIMAKAIDNRVGCAIMIELLKHAPKQANLCFSFTVQGAVGLRGVKTSAYAFDPDVAISINATPAYDIPAYDGRQNSNYNSRLGLGPAIGMSNSSSMADPRLVKYLAAVADKNQIPYQFRQPDGESADTSPIQGIRSGLPTVSVSVPHRYPGSPISIARIADWEKTLNLLNFALLEISNELIGW